MEIAVDEQLTKWTIVNKSLFVSYLLPHISKTFTLCKKCIIGAFSEYSYQMKSQESRYFLIRIFITLNINCLLCVQFGREAYYFLLKGLEDKHQQFLCFTTSDFSNFNNDKCSNIEIAVRSNYRLMICTYILSKVLK